MGPTRVEVDRFDGNGDFALWRQRMRAILMQMKVAKALDGADKLSTELKQEEKDDMMELAYNTIILHLGNRMLREVSKETTAAGLWFTLKQLYMTKTFEQNLLSLPIFTTPGEIKIPDDLLLLYFCRRERDAFQPCGQDLISYLLQSSSSCNKAVRIPAPPAAAPAKTGPNPSYSRMGRCVYSAAPLSSELRPVTVSSHQELQQQP